MRRTILPLLLLVVAGCQPATMALTADQRAAITDTVKALNADAWDAWRAVDLEKAFSILHNSPDLWWAEQGHVWQGYADVTSGLRASFGNVSHFNITISDSRTVVLAADAVATLEQGVFTATDSAGMTSPEQPFVMSATWVRRSGEWKVLYGHESWPMPEADSIG